MGSPPPDSLSMDESTALMAQFDDGSHQWVTHWDRSAGFPTLGAVPAVVQSLLRLIWDWSS